MLITEIEICCARVFRFWLAKVRTESINYAKNPILFYSQAGSSLENIFEEVKSLRYRERAIAIGFAGLPNFYDFFIFSDHVIVRFEDSVPVPDFIREEIEGCDLCALEEQQMDTLASPLLYRHDEVMDAAGVIMRALVAFIYPEEVEPFGNLSALEEGCEHDLERGMAAYEDMLNIECLLSGNP